MLSISGTMKGLDHKMHTYLQPPVTCFTKVTKKGNVKYLFMFKDLETFIASPKAALHGSGIIYAPVKETL